MIRVPLDEPTVLEPGIAYSVELHGRPGEDLTAKVRGWRVTDVAEPVTVEEETTADYVLLKELPTP